MFAAKRMKMAASRPGDWTPARIATTVWFDAADSDTITLSSGVSSWADKSGNNRNATQGDTSYRPGVSQWDVDKVAIDFGDNSRACLLFDHPPFTSTHGFVIHAVAMPSNYTGRQDILRRGYGQATLDFELGEWFKVRSEELNDYTVSAGPANWLNGVKQYMSAGYINSDQLFIKRNGVVQEASNVTYTPRQIFQEVFIGTGPSSDGSTSPTSLDWAYDGLVGEIIFVTGTVNSKEGNRIEGYLAHKWGLESHLPEGHPYKNLAP